MQTTRQFVRVRSALRIPAVLALAAAPGAASGQSASIGADVVSRYVWRGADFGESMSVQPALTLSYGNLEVGAWGSYSVSAPGAGANENDLWAAYTVSSANGASISFGVTDYYFPAPGSDDEPAPGFLEKDAHTLELSLAFSGPESFPISLFGGMLTRNDPDNSVYLEASCPVGMAEGVEVGLVAGMVTGASEFYGTDGAGFVNLGISASSALAITGSYAPPVSVSYVFNPAADRAYLVFGLSLVP